MAVTRWIFNTGKEDEYTFERNPDRSGGDSYWNTEMRYREINPIGSSTPNIHVDGFNGGRRTVRFTAISGNMLRTLQQFYWAGQLLTNCRDHLYSTTPEFNCIITGFTPALHPTTGDYPGTGEDTWDLEMILTRMS